MTPTKPTQESMAALLALAEKATPGPWVRCEGQLVWDDGALTCSGCAALVSKEHHIIYEVRDDDDPEDAATQAYVAAASPEVVAGLVAEIERLREALRGAEKWAHVLDWGMGLPDDESNDFASMTPKAARGHKWHASMCPGCAARKALAEDR